MERYRVTAAHNFEEMFHQKLPQEEGISNISKCTGLINLSKLRVTCTNAGDLIIQLRTGQCVKQREKFEKYKNLSI